DGRAARRADRARVAKDAVLDAHARPLAVLLSGHERHARAGGDGRERLAAEPARHDRGEIVIAADLRRRMLLEREQGVVPIHAAPIVAHENESLASFLELDVDATGARVERVLDELLHDGRGTLDDLARGDAVGERLG